MFSPALESPLYYLSKKQLFRHHKRKALPIYLKSCQFFGATLIDRTGTLESGFDFKIIDQLPAQKSDHSFADACTLRARHILAHSTGLLHVLWSGGIDSTLALVSLIDVCRQEEQLHRLKVTLSQESINEYPTFFKDVIEGQINYRLITDTIFESVAPSDVIVTGEHGDQLFGSDKLKYTILSGDAFTPYEQILDFVIARKLGTDRHTTSIIDYLNPLVARAPVPVISLYDYLWWLNFSLKWQTVSMRLVHGLGRAAADLEQTVFHFYKSTAFQQWSLSHHDQKIKAEWSSYKYVAKELIYQFHADEHYLLHKEKEPSLKEVMVSGKPRPGFVGRLFARKASELG